MTEKIARRGLRIPEEYDADVFRHTLVADIMDKDIKTLPSTMLVSELAARIAQHDPSLSVHHAWPILDSSCRLCGILTRNDLLRALEKPAHDHQTILEAGNSSLVVAHPDESVHEAIARMIGHDIRRLLVVERAEPRRLIGYISATSLLAPRFWKPHHEHVRETGWLDTLRRQNTTP